MSRLMSVTEFVREHAPEMDVSTVHFYIKKYGILFALVKDGRESFEIKKRMENSIGSLLAFLL